MINKPIILCYFLVLFSTKIIAQSNSLSGSPYSLYGLGQINKTTTGKINGLGRSGIAMTSNTFINNSNPASLGSLPLERFYFDFGFKGETNFVTENGRKDTDVIANFSNVAIAFPISKKSGLAITLIPFSSVGYTIDDIQTNIEGSIYSYFTDIEGEGGINILKMDYGYALNNKLRLGLTGSVLFGQISQKETNTIPIIANNILSNSVISLYDENYYSGVRFGTGIQYDVSNKISFGAIVNLPTILNGDKKRRANSSTESLDISHNDIEDFHMPLEIGFGFHSKFKEHFTFNLDYKKNFWGSTNQSDQLGTYVNHDFFGLGIQFAPKNRNPKFFNNLDYRVGFNFDNGNLEIDKQRIKNNEINLGIGIPLSDYSNSMINIGYSYGNKGQITSGLIKENYHLLSLNLSFQAIWFQKRKYD